MASRFWKGLFFCGLTMAACSSVNPLRAENLAAPSAIPALTPPVPLPPPTIWNGYTRSNFMVDGRACILVHPKQPAWGNPWIWRTEFFGTASNTDLVLLSKGYFVAYMNVQNMYGAPVALDHLDKFYDFLEQKDHLAPKTVLVGISRGGLFALNWARRHPDRIACLYLDAPVCDIASWPGGKGHGQGSPKDWAKLKAVYGLTDDQAMHFAGNPVDNLKPLAAARIPILGVCGDADKTVPADENILVVEKRYKAMGGDIQVIVKPGGDHHPHGLPDPTPIVNFILAHSSKN